MSEVSSQNWIAYELKRCHLLYALLILDSEDIIDSEIAINPLYAKLRSHVSTASRKLT